MILIEILLGLHILLLNPSSFSISLVKLTKQSRSPLSHIVRTDCNLIHSNLLLLSLCEFLLVSLRSRDLSFYWHLLRWCCLLWFAKSKDSSSIALIYCRLLLLDLFLK